MHDSRETCHSRELVCDANITTVARGAATAATTRAAVGSLAADRRHAGVSGLFLVLPLAAVFAQACAGLERRTSRRSPSPTPCRPSG